LALWRARHGKPAPGTIAVLTISTLVLVAWLGAAVVAFDAGTAVSLVAGAAAAVVSGTALWAVALGLERRHYRDLRRRLAARDAEVIKRLQRSEPGDRDAEVLKGSISGYEIRKQIGSGATGVVFSALHKRLERDVALKLVDLDLSEDEGYRARFLS